MFSPYYAAARTRHGAGAALATEHNAVNLSLYTPRGKRWTMTERGSTALRRDARTLCIGPSRLAWEGDALVLDVDELTVPWPSRVRGRIRLHPRSVNHQPFELDSNGRHRWWPIAPCARIEVELSQPQLRWQGTAYLDTNRGDVPLEQDFVRWHWSRAGLAGGRAAVLYDAQRRDGSRAALALRFDAHGAVERFEPPAHADLPASAWRIERATRGDAGHVARVQRGLEDGPFYARSLIESRWDGETVHAMHESLDLDRFRSPVVRAMLPFRMPRRAVWPGDT